MVTASTYFDESLETKVMYIFMIIKATQLNQKKKKKKPKQQIEMFLSDSRPLPTGKSVLV